MKTFVVLTLDARRPKQDGTSPIVIRITHHGKKAQMITGFYVKESDWNEPGRCIKPTYKGTESVTRLNNQLQKKKTEVVDFIAKLDERKVLDTLSVKDLKDLIERKSERSSFGAYAQKCIEALEKANRVGNARWYKMGIAALKTFNNGQDITFIELNRSFLMRWETAHLAKGLSYNGLSAYLRAIRAIYNLAIADKLVDKDLYPFAEYEIKTSETRKRAISTKALQSIIEKHYEPKHKFFHARNYFLFSLYCRGMTFADIAYLKVKDTFGGRIFYFRRKTGKAYSVEINEKIQQILDYYIKDKQPDYFVFPILKRLSAADQYKDLVEARRRFNKKLKKIATDCGIEENLTSYVSRHSFATIAKNMGIDTASISDMLGHGDIKTTQVYLASLGSDTLDSLHNKVIEKIATPTV